ncbi:hypothetical protein M1M86_02005 [Dehalococcoidales bacterium]|nr:hypothetical protein [Dehalococcoidales bacterium]MCL0094556.1 hypothetical protein [Dehalococcoidales bacterium]
MNYGIVKLLGCSVHMRNYTVHLLKRNYLKKGTALPGFQLNISEKRMQVVVDPRHTAICLGDVPNIGYCIDNVRGVFRKISDLITLPPLVRLGVRSYWIQESKLEFKELVSAYKQIIYKPSSIVEESIDVGASFILKDGKYRAYVSFGPMEQSQLKTMFVFEPPKLPQVVSFLDVDYYLLMEKAEVTERMLRDFVNTGLNYASEQRRRLMSILPKEE